MCAQNHAAAIGLLVEIKRVMLLPRGMLLRNVQRREVMKVILDMRPFSHTKSKITKNLDNFFPHLADGMHGAARLSPRGQSHINFFRCQTLFKLGFLQHRFARRNRIRHRVFQNIKGCTCSLPLIG